MLKNPLSLTILSMAAALTFNVSAKAQIGVQPEAKLIYRFEQRIEYPADYEVSTKAVQSLLKYVDAKNSNDRVAIRLCSNEPILRAFYMATGSPWEIWGHMVTGWLGDWHKTPPERTLVLRSTDCLGNDATVAPVELWALPNGVSPPPFVESMKFCQLNFDYIVANQLKGSRPRLIRKREYETALRRLVAKLRTNPKALGLIWGQFLRERTPVMEQHLREVQSLMERYNIPQNRYVVRLSQFGGDFHPSTPEPKYPDVDVVNLSRQCKRD
jgi:hypothetical protein